MADQTNPWDSAPATDGAAQAADAWGGASTAAPANGGGADWLHSAPAPQPESFNIMDPFHKTLIPLDSWVTHAIDWIVLHFRPAIPGDPRADRLHPQRLPAAVVGDASAGGDYRLRADRLADLQPRHGGRHHWFSLIAIGAIGAWSQAMVTLALVLTALLFCMVIGLPLGIWLAAQPAGGKNYPPAARCHADHAGLRLPGCRS